MSLLNLRNSYQEGSLVEDLALHFHKNSYRLN
jgi:hypothetical protein